MDKKIKVGMYCKVYTENFPDHPEYMNGKEIFDFLMSDLGCTFKQYNEDSEEDPILMPGDILLWYLGCNEKHGVLEIENQSWEWDWGGASFSRVKRFINSLNKRGVFTEEQYKILNEKIEEGRKIDWMYDIGDYLQSKYEGKVWKNKSEEGRKQSKQFIGNVLEGFKSMGYDVKPVGKTQDTITLNAEVKKED